MSAALPTPPAPPAPPAPPGVESPPSAPGPGLVVGGASHGSHRRRGGGLRPPSLLHPGQGRGQPAQGGGATRVTVNPPKASRLEEVRSAMRQHARNASPGPDLAKMDDAVPVHAESKGQGPKKVAFADLKARNEREFIIPKSAKGRGRAAQAARGVRRAMWAGEKQPAQVAPGVPLDPDDMDAEPQLAPGHDAKGVFDKLERTDLP